MTILIRNFFHAVGFTVLFALHGLNADTAQFSDLVRLTQSQTALQLALVLTAVLVGLELVCGLGNWRRSSSKVVTASRGGVADSTSGV